jgi:hypothetical protein
MTGFCQCKDTKNTQVKERASDFPFKVEEKKRNRVSNLKPNIGYISSAFADVIEEETSFI